MPWFKKEKLPSDSMKLGSEVWFCRTYSSELKIQSGIIKEIYLSGKTETLAVDTGSYTERDIRERFFTSKNECVQHWIDKLKTHLD